MKRILVLVFLLSISLFCFAQQNKSNIVVFDPISSFQISDGTDVMVREITSSVVVNSGLYNIIDRRTVSKILEEQDFARSGLMDETQAVQIGKLAGAKSVLFSVLAKSGTKTMLTTKLIDVYSGLVEKQKFVLLDHSVDLVTEVERLTNSLIGHNSKQSSYYNSTSSNDSYFVDLGLPSGTSWARTNEGGNHMYYTYDDAVSKFGNKLPSKVQLEELKNKCTWTWTGMGYEVIGPNGKSIYLHAAGYRNCNGEVDVVDTAGIYWSSSPSGTDNAYCISFDSDWGVNVPGYYSRCNGQSVRLVMD